MTPKVRFGITGLAVGTFILAAQVLATSSAAAPADAAPRGRVVRATAASEARSAQQRAATVSQQLRREQFLQLLFQRRAVTQQPGTLAVGRQQSGTLAAGRSLLMQGLGVARMLPVRPEAQIRLIGTGLATLGRAIRQPIAGPFVDFFRERHLLRAIGALTRVSQQIEQRIAWLNSLTPRTPAQAFHIAAQVARLNQRQAQIETTIALLRQRLPATPTLPPGPPFLPPGLPF